MAKTMESDLIGLGLKAHGSLEPILAQRRLEPFDERPDEIGVARKEQVPCAVVSEMRVSRVPGGSLASSRTVRAAYGSWLLATSNAGRPPYCFMAASIRTPR